MTRRTRAAMVATGLVFVATVPLAAQSLVYTGSLHFSTGDYIFSEPTHTWTLYNGLGVRMERLRLSLGMPLVLQNTWAGTYVGGSAIPTGGPDYRLVRQRVGGGRIPMTSRRGSSGRGTGRMSVQLPSVVDTVAGPGDYELDLADPLLSGTVELYRGWSLLRSVEITAAARAPIRSIDSGVGTGEWDVGGGASLALGFGRVLVFGDASYWRYGDLPDMELIDGMSYAAAVGFPIGSESSLMASYSGSERIIGTVDPYAMLTISGSRNVGEAKALTAGVGIGLSEASPHVSVFMGWRFGLADTRRNSSIARTN